MKKKGNDKCEFCDGTVQSGIIQTRFNFKGQTIYIDRVPAWVCTKCGEHYFDAPVYKRLEEIAKHRTRIKKQICFPLAQYDSGLVQP